MKKDAIAKFKQLQKEGWAHFASLEALTTVTAARLVKFAGLRPGQAVLDVACGTGVVAITAARSGTKVTGIDLTPELLERARENSRIAEVDVDWREGDAEALPFDDGAFDVVLSQFGHMFAPRPDVAIGEMLRVLKPGGVIAFSTWPPELMIGRSFTLVGSYMPAPPPGVSPPPQWGDVAIVKERLGSAVREIAFDRDRMLFPALSIQHYRLFIERTAGPMLKLVEMLSGSDPERLAKFRGEYDALTVEYFADNIVRQDYLLTRAIKV
jgi:SAM-dependent methyltransferase